MIGEAAQRIDLNTWTTPNCQKVNIAVTELGVDDRPVPIDIREGRQFDPEILRIRPNTKVPAIVDHETGITMMESGAILLYLAQRGEADRVGGRSSGNAPSQVRLRRTDPPLSGEGGAQAIASPSGVAGLAEPADSPYKRREFRLRPPTSSVSISA